MTNAITQTVALETEQRAEGVRSHHTAIRQIRHRHHARQIAQALGPLNASGGERRRRLADDASRFRDRASMLLAAEVRVASAPAEKAVVRNISAAGLMVEMETVLTRGEFISLKLGDLGWTDGTVVWKVGKRFGVSFFEEIDPRNVRKAIGATPRSYEATAVRRIF